MRKSRMREMMRQRRKSMFICTCIVFAILFVSLIVFTNDYYRADEEAIEIFMQDNNITEETLPDGSIACIPENPVAGVIFYPETKVEHTAYLPLMRAFADEGIVAISIKMPYNLPILKQTAADGIRELFPEVESWYMAGHAKGGEIAAKYVSVHQDSFDGLILLSAYSKEDISATDLKVATIYGDLDKIMDLNAYKDNRINLPKSHEATIIEGANHSGFGMYGLQEGDGEATITNTRQIKETAAIIAEFVK